MDQISPRSIWYVLNHVQAPPDLLTAATAKHLRLYSEAGDHHARRAHWSGRLRIRLEGVASPHTTHR